MVLFEKRSHPISVPSWYGRLRLRPEVSDEVKADHLTLNRCAARPATALVRERDCRLRQIGARAICDQIGIMDCQQRPLPVRMRSSICAEHW